ncbi:uncharacterized protein LOC119727231 [Patiria miniata]|uniref:Uncharacterized protein n=1 Tax=Patiria miniata TaxID=46514 RepID=A0A913ZUT8_PATMI|nr:uncharacterized protein LOC119727231 [Patiria miniata]
MAPSGRIFLFIVLVLVIHLTEPKDGYSAFARSRSRRSSTRRTTYYRSHTTYSYTGYGSSGGYGTGLTWWQICLIIGGILFGFLVLYCSIRACRRLEPESDTPGIHTTRDQIQLRDHQIIQHSPTTNYQPIPCSDGREIPPPPVIMHNQPAPAPYGVQPQLQQLPGPMATAPPPCYDDALDIAEEPIAEGAVDRWEDQPEVNRKDFGVI